MTKQFRGIKEKRGYKWTVVVQVPLSTKDVSRPPVCQSVSTTPPVNEGPACLPADRLTVIVRPSVRPSILLNDRRLSAREAVLPAAGRTTVFCPSVRPSAHLFAIWPPTYQRHVRVTSVSHLTAGCVWPSVCLRRTIVLTLCRELLQPEERISYTENYCKRPRLWGFF